MTVQALLEGQGTNVRTVFCPTIHLQQSRPFPVSSQFLSPGIPFSETRIGHTQMPSC